MNILKGRVIDGNGGKPIEKGIVAVDGSKIVYVGEEAGYAVSPEDRVFDFSGNTIMPGFIEQHTHFGFGTVNLMNLYTHDDVQKGILSARELAVFLNSGFTSVRECGGLATSFVEPIANGVIKGPRLFPAGKFLTQTGGHADVVQTMPVEFTNIRVSHTRIVDGRDDCRKAAREQFRSGAKFLKIMTTGGITTEGDGNKESQFSPEEISVFVEEAEMHDTYVSAHAEGTQGIKNALKCGVKSIEHGMFMDDECIELMVKNEAWLIPTFTIIDTYLRKLDKLAPRVREKVLASSDAHKESVRRCYEAGVKIGFGSDLTDDKEICPFGINGREFELLTKIGMTPMEAITAGTKTGAEITKMSDKVGTLEVGKLADITVCRGDPITDIKILSEPDNIMFVMLDGDVMKYPAENIRCGLI